MSDSGKFALQTCLMPTLQGPGDAIVRMSKTTLRGTDLHIFKGDVPSCEPGRFLGHEGVGVVHEIGSGVSTLKPGDHVRVSCAFEEMTKAYETFFHAADTHALKVIIEM